MGDGVPVRRSATAGDPGGRMAERASLRARDLHRMRWPILGLVCGIAFAQFVLTALWLAALFTDNEPAARAWGLMGVFVNLVITLILVFVTWIVLEALGRIERETDRVQQFMDTVYRRLA